MAPRCLLVAGRCPVGADEALARLIEGDARFLRGAARFTRRSQKCSPISSRPRPFATVLCCSDSRVPPELIFDAKIGDLFVVRVAGNVMSPEVGGSLQYAGTHLRTQLFMVSDTRVRGSAGDARSEISGRAGAFAYPVAA